MNTQKLPTAAYSEHVILSQAQFIKSLSMWLGMCRLSLHSTTCGLFIE